MELNIDCVRDVLLTIEDSPINKCPNVNEIIDKLDYNEDTVYYALLKMGEADYIDIETANFIGYSLPQIVRINGLTYKGHTYLESARDKTIWEKAKRTANDKGVPVTLEIIGELASSIIKKTLGL